MDFDVVPQVASWVELNENKQTSNVAKRKKESLKTFTCFLPFYFSSDVFRLTVVGQNILNLRLSSLFVSLSACILCYEEGCLFKTEADQPM